jgi:hypothetical protein
MRWAEDQRGKAPSGFGILSFVTLEFEF